MTTTNGSGKKTRKKLPRNTDHGVQPYNGPATVDATPVLSVLVDVGESGRQGLRTPGPGIEEVDAELALAMAANGAAAGVPMAVYQSYQQNRANIAKIAQVQAPATKLAEVLTETRAVLEDACEQELSVMVDAMKSMAKRKKNAALLAPFQKTIAYKARTADKAAKTRKAKKAGAAAPAPPAPPVPTTSGTGTTTGH